MAIVRKDTKKRKSSRTWKIEERTRKQTSQVALSKRCANGSENLLGNINLPCPAKVLCRRDPGTKKCQPSALRTPTTFTGELEIVFIGIRIRIIHRAITAI